MNVAPGHDRTISIDWKIIHEILVDKIKELAVFRCQMMRKGRAKKQGDVQDEDYTVRGMKMLNCLIYLDGRKASFLISLSYLPLLLLSPPADLVMRLQL